MPSEIISLLTAIKNWTSRMSINDAVSTLPKGNCRLMVSDELDEVGPSRCVLRRLLSPPCCESDGV